MIHSGEYFHGPFEMTSETQPMILLMATGRSRFLDERVLKFLKTYAKRFIVIDAKDTGIEEDVYKRQEIDCSPKSKWRNITRSASSPHEKRWMNWQLRDLLKRNRGRAPL